MKSRSELKRIALANFNAIYWPAVGKNVLLIISGLLFICVPGSIGARLQSVIHYDLSYVFSFIGLFAYLAIFGVAQAFYGMVVYFGDRTNCRLSSCLKVGSAKILRNAASWFVYMLLIYLWSLLFVIPGIIKCFSYAMTPYILADCPGVGPIDAISISKRMMKEHKWELFGLQLSFIGWSLLSAITFGLVGIFYFFPYFQATMAGYYVEIKRNAILEGRVEASEFEGNAKQIQPVQAAMPGVYNHPGAQTPPMYQQPVVQQPVMQQPVVQQPMAQQPMYQPQSAPTENVANSDSGAGHKIVANQDLNDIFKQVIQPHETPATETNYTAASQPMAEMNSIPASQPMAEMNSIPASQPMAEMNYTPASQFVTEPIQPQIISGTESAGEEVVFQEEAETQAESGVVIENPEFSFSSNSNVKI